MKEMYAKWHDKGLEYVYVADNDSNPDNWRKAIKEDGLEAFHHVLRGLKSTVRMAATNLTARTTSARNMPSISCPRNTSSTVRARLWASLRATSWKPS